MNFRCLINFTRGVNSIRILDIAEDGFRSGDERYRLSAADAVAVGLLFFCRIVMVASSCFGCACVCVILGYFKIWGYRSHWNGCMKIA